MRKVAVITGSRADFGLLRPILREIIRRDNLELLLCVTGMHLIPEFGLTVQEIEAEGFSIAECVDVLLSSDSPAGIAKAMGLGTLGFAQTYERLSPDLILLIGDRSEMHAAAVAAIPFNIPLVHIHGGELTEGAIDESFRHSLTKMSHLHFTSTEEYRKRVEQMGEEPWRVEVSGAPSLDNLAGINILTREEFERRFDINLSVPFLLVTFHSTTLEMGQAASQTEELLAAISLSGQFTLFTLANADVGGKVINTMIRKYVESSPSARIIENLGTQGYFSAMSLAAAMVGNSSSGIIEAASFGLPVVNVGTRQDGRMRGANVLQVDCNRIDIVNGINQVISPEFRARITNIKNCYGTGNAARCIVDRIVSEPLNARLLRKKFYQLPDR